MLGDFNSYISLPPVSLILLSLLLVSPLLLNSFLSISSSLYLRYLLVYSLDLRYVSNL